MAREGDFCHAALIIVIAIDPVGGLPLFMFSYSITPSLASSYNTPANRKVHADNLFFLLHFFSE